MEKPILKFNYPIKKDSCSITPVYPKFIFVEYKLTKHRRSRRSVKVSK